MLCKHLQIITTNIQKRFYKKQAIRVRFAPSPTGHLHLGGLRTALYNYLFARKNAGAFLLRIEDTDQTRLEPAAMEKLRENLIWAGIIPDEDPVRGGPKGPYIQSKRLEIYSEHVQKLLSNKSAYYCFCTEQRLDLLRRAALKARQVPKYDNRCRHLEPGDVRDKLKHGEAHCIRFKLAEEAKSWHDLVYGDVPASQQEGDPVIMKSDGFPTYHFANVVDDHLMEISHVLRGVEWQLSTQKHMELYRAFGWEPPKFAHLPLILNPNGSKLSKRQGDINIDFFKQDGIFPLALINYITFAGGGFNRLPGSLVLYSYQELIKQFDLMRINTNSSKLTPENLLEFNRLEIYKLLESEKDSKYLVNRVQNLIIDTFSNRVKDGSLRVDDEHVLNVLNWAKNRMTRLRDLVDKKLAFLWIVPSSSKIQVVEDKMAKSMENLNRQLADLESCKFETKNLTQYLRDYASNNGLSYPELMKVMRHMLSGLDQGPAVAEMMEMLGKKRSLERLSNFRSERRTAAGHQHWRQRGREPGTSHNNHHPEIPLSLAATAEKRHS